MTTTTTLGPRLARKPLHLFWILDTSGSMGAAGKIDALNAALRDAVPALRTTVEDNPGVELLVRVVAFDHDARWHVAEPVPIERFEWTDLAVTPEGTTELGRAIDLVVGQIRELAAARRGMPPALVLVSDGRPTDLKRPTFGAALRALREEPWGRKASLMAIGIGADADMEALSRFIGHDEIPPIRAGNAAELAHYLRWASTVVVDELGRTGGVAAVAHGPAGSDPGTPDAPTRSRGQADERPTPAGQAAPTRPVGPADRPAWEPPSGPRVDLPPPGQVPPPPPPPFVPAHDEHDDDVTW